MCPKMPNAPGSPGSKPQLVGEILKESKLSSENGYMGSSGPTGAPSPSDLDAPAPVKSPTNIELDGVTAVRLHHGLSTISVGGLEIDVRDVQGSFTALKVEDSGGYMVTLSCVLTATEYSLLVDRLGAGKLTSKRIMLSETGEPDSVDVRFVPTTPNLVPVITSESI